MSIRYHKIYAFLIDFNSQDEFCIKILREHDLENTEDSLSEMVLEVVKLAADSNERVVFICKANDSFRVDYNFADFRRLIDSAEKNGAEVLVGGTRWFDYAVKITEDLYWLNAFSGWEFIVIFKPGYEKLIKYSYSVGLAIDQVISMLSDQIFVMVPSLSTDVEYTEIILGEKEDLGTSKFVSLVNDRLAALSTVQRLVDRLGNVDFSHIDYKNLRIATYIINLPERIDRLTHMQSQFEGKSEFAIQIFKACRHVNGALGLWNSIKEIIRQALKADDDVVIICEDDHTFSEAYTKEILFKAIYQGAYLGADLILGGISNTQQGIVVTPELCWIDSFQCTQFTIVYHSLFEEILTTDFTDKDAADLKLSTMTANKYVIHPFISTQHDFGYSDIPIEGVDTKDYQGWFSQCERKLTKIRTIHDKFHAKERSR